MAESYSVKAILSAQDRGFSSAMKSALGASESLSSKISSGLGFGVLVGAGQAAFNAITSGLTGVAGKVVETGKSFETATSQIAATMGKPKNEIQDIIDKAEELGRTTKFTATEAAEGFNILAQSGLDAEQQLGSAEKVLQLAAAGAYEMDAAASQVVGTMKGFSMAMNDAAETEASAAKVADILAKGATMANTDVNQLGVALSTASSNAAQYGQTLEGTGTALLRLAEQNLTGSEAATALSMAMKNIYAPTNEAKEVLEKLGVKAYDTTGKARDFNTVVDEVNAALHEQYGNNEELINQDINKIFDARSARVFGKMIVSDSEKVEEFREGLENASDGVGAAAQQASTQLDNLEGDMTLFSSATDGLYNAIFKNMDAPMRAFYKVATTAITGVTGLVENLGDKLAGGIDLEKLQEALDENGLAGAVGVLSESLGGLIPGLKNVGTVGGAALAALAASKIFASENWAVVSKGIYKVAAGAKGAATSIAGLVPSGLAGKVGGALSGIGGKIAQTGQAAKTVAGTMWNNFASDSLLGKAVSKVGGFAGKVGGVLGQISGTVLNVGGQLAGGLQTMMGMAMEALLPAALIGAALAGLGLLQDKFGEQIDGILSMVREKAPGIVGNLAEGIASRVPELISQGAELVSGFLETIGTVAPSVVAAGAQIIASLVSGVAENAPQLITGAVTAVGGFASGILSSIPSLLVAGMQLLLGVAQGIAQNLPRMAQGAVQAVQGFIQGISSNFPAILSTAGQIVLSLVQGITSALPSLAAGAVGIIGTLISGFIQNLPQIIQTGVQVIASLALGIISGIGTLIGMVPQLFSTVADTIMNTDWLDVGSKIVSAIGDGIMGAIGGIGGKIGEFFGGIGDWITGGESGGRQYAEAASETIEASAPVVTAAAQTAATTVSTESAAAFLQGGAEGGLGLMTGFQTGINDNMGMLTDAAITATTSVTDILTDGSFQSDADSAGQDIVQSAADGIDSGSSAAESALQVTMDNAIFAIDASSGDAQAAGEAVGTAAVTGLATGISPFGETAQAAVAAAVSSMQSGLSTMQSAGQQAGTQFAAGIRTGLTQAATAAKTSAKTITASLKSAVSPAQAAGKNAGSRFAAGIRAGVSAARSAGNAAGKAAVAGMKSGSSGARNAGNSAGSSFASGISSKSGSARSAGSSLAHAAKSGMSGVSTSSIGRDMGQGLVNGLNSKYSSVAAAARRLANAAAEAMRNAAKVASPSKVTTKIGMYVGEGLSLGIQKQTSGAVQQARGFMGAALQAMRDEAQVHSPSKATESIAFQLAAGISKGLEYNAGKTAKAAASFAAGTVKALQVAAQKAQKEKKGWGKNDFLRKGLAEVNKWGTTAAALVKKAVSKTKNAFGSNMKSTASSVAKSLKSAMTAKAKNISDSASGLITTAVNNMVKKAQAQQERYKKAYENISKLQKEYEKKANDKKAGSAEKKAAKAKAKEYAALAKKYKAASEKFKTLASSYSKAGSTMKTAFTTAFNSKINAAITSTTNAITKLGETYQKKYDAIISARKNFRDKMRELSIGEIIEDEATGKSSVVLTDYNVATRQVKQYGKNLEKLKKVLPQGLMNEILEMDTAEGYAFTQRLLKMSSSELKKYAKSYSQFQSATTSVSNKYYQNQINDLKSSYTKAVEKEFKELQKSLKTIGQQVMQGFADGMKSKKTALDNAGKSLADSVIKTLKTRLKIHSPSRVARGLGSFVGEGFALGMDREREAVERSAERLLQLPEVRRPAPAFNYGSEALALNSDYEYSADRTYVIEVPVTVDGREFARATGKYNETELERRRRNSERLKGRR